MKTDKFTAQQIAALIKEFGSNEVTSGQLWVFDKNLLRIAQNGGAEKIRRGVWRLPKIDMAAESAPEPEEQAESLAAHAVARVATADSVKSKFVNAASRFANENIPAVDARYVPFGEFALIKKIIASKKFFPVFITGESGNGKTMMVQQACAAANRELFRINFTPRTDEGELIGEVGLTNGETAFEEGVVIAAMRRGGVLLLDEVDYASAEGFTPLQSILEGAPYLIKKTGEIIKPAEGFTIIATANTKGQGDSSGKYYGAQLLNEAFLERFPIVIEQEYPTEQVEMRILTTFAKAEGISITEEEVSRLVNWAKAIRKSYENQSIEYTMTTRRLVHVLRAYGIIGNLRKSVEVCVARFDAATSKAFVQFYAALEPATAASPKKAAGQPNANEGSNND